MSQVEQPKKVRRVRRGRTSGQNTSQLLDESLRQLLMIDLEKGFVEWYRLYALHIMQYLRALTSGSEYLGDIDDIFQEVCVSVYNNMKKHEKDDQWFLELRIGWFIHITKNAFLKWLRQYYPGRKHKMQITLVSEKELQLADVRPVNPLIAAIINECMEQLTKAQREAIQLSCIQGNSYLDVSIKLHVPVGTVKSHISRGKAALRRCLQEKGVGK